MIHSDGLVITDLQSALDLIGNVSFTTNAKRIIIDKALICEEFFDLSSKLAGDVLQKFINYQTKLAIVGDFSGYSSESLKAFIYECNQGKDIFFLETKENVAPQTKYNSTASKMQLQVLNRA